MDVTASNVVQISSTALAQVLKKANLSVTDVHLSVSIYDNIRRSGISINEVSTVL